VLAVCVAFGLLAGLAAASFFCCPSILCVDSGRRPADAIVLLGGDAAERTWRVLELFKTGNHRLVFVTGDGPQCSMSKRLELAGIPASRIVLETNATSTKLNAQLTVPLLRQQGVKRAVIVTSWYHSRRALASFRHFAPDIELSSIPAFSGSTMKGKPALDDVFMVYREYLKLAYYWVRYGISPFYRV